MFAFLPRGFPSIGFSLSDSVYCRRLWKTFWNKEKLLVMSIFSSCNTVFILLYDCMYFSLLEKSDANINKVAYKLELKLKR